MLSRRMLLGGLLAGHVFAKSKLFSRIGLEIYSLRAEAEKNLPACLSNIRRLGIREVEVSGLYGHSAAQFRQLLNTNDLRATSMMAEYDELAHDTEAVAARAHTLGAGYVVCGTIPHKLKYLSVEDCGPAAKNLNLWGERLHRAGLGCCYHTHGTEFQRFENRTVFDVLAQEADPRYLNFEMDIFWIVYGFQDPAAMLKRYAGRFPLMHVKDIRKGTVLGGSPADVREEDSVPLGQGLVDIPAALRAAEQFGVQHYYIEDEAVDALAQLPTSLAYLRKLDL